MKIGGKQHCVADPV